MMSGLPISAARAAHLSSVLFPASLLVANACVRPHVPTSLRPYVRTSVYCCRSSSFQLVCIIIFDPSQSETLRAITSCLAEAVTEIDKAGQGVAVTQAKQMAQMTSNGNRKVARRQDMLQNVATVH